MSQQLPIPEPLWDTIPADAQAALPDAWKTMEDRIAELEAIVRDLQGRLQLGSGRPFGAADWTDRIAERLGIDLTPPSSRPSSQGKNELTPIMLAREK